MGLSTPRRAHVVENPTERDLEIEGTLAEGIGGTAAVIIGIALIVIHG
jgi:hypothetical protein